MLAALPDELGVETGKQLIDPLAPKRQHVVDLEPVRDAATGLAGIRPLERELVALDEGDRLEGVAQRRRGQQPCDAATKDDKVIERHGRPLAYAVESVEGSSLAGARSISPG